MYYVLVLSCYITTYLPKHSGLKQQAFIISQFRRVSSVEAILLEDSESRSPISLQSRCWMELRHLKASLRLQDVLPNSFLWLLARDFSSSCQGTQFLTVWFLPELFECPYDMADGTPERESRKSPFFFILSFFFFFFLPGPG